MLNEESRLLLYLRSQKIKTRALVTLCELFLVKIRPLQLEKTALVRSPHSIPLTNGAVQVILTPPPSNGETRRDNPVLVAISEHVI